MRVKLFLEKDCKNQFCYLEVMIPVDYPMKPPNIKFDSKFWHPNITIQNEFVNNLKSSWSPKTSIMNVINSLHEFLCEDQP